MKELMATAIAVAILPIAFAGTGPVVWFDMETTNTAGQIRNLGSAGATAEDIALMRRECDADTRIKAAGGIRSQEAAQQMLDNGAVRIGASKL